MRAPVRQAFRSLTRLSSPRNGAPHDSACRTNGAPAWGGPGVWVIAGGCILIMPPSPGSGPGTRRRWAGCSARCCGCWPPRAFAGPAQPGWHEAGRQRRAEGGQDVAADREDPGRGGRARRRRGRPLWRRGGEPAPRALARRAERRERLAAARDRLPAEDQGRRDAQRASRRPGTPRQLSGVRGLPGGRRASRAPTAATPRRGRTLPTRTCG